MPSSHLDRRSVLLFFARAVASGMVLLPRYAPGQAPPRPPGAPSAGPAGDPTKTKIAWEEYQRWLRSVRGVAEKIATESGARLPESASEEFDQKARDTLESNGYQRPSPPTGLRIIN